jgi:hypothetical protein
MNGWRYEWVDALPREVYDVLVETLNAEHQARERDE